MTPTLALDALPVEVREVFDRFLVCEYASLTRAGRPVTWAVTPYVSPGTLDVSTGLSYPDKAERARRNPRVALLYSDPTGSGLDSAPVVLVEGLATVRDADLQAGTDRYVRESLRKTTGMDGVPWLYLRRLGWYFSRVWVEVTPETVTWWPGGDLSAEPRTWRADTVDAPPSDPAPRGPRAPSRTAAPVDWRPYADRGVALGAPVATMVRDGRPVTVRTRAAERTDDGFTLTLPAGVAAVAGPVCLTFHRFGPGLEWQENVVLLGTAVPGAHDDELDVTVERALCDWSLAGSKRQRARALLGPGKELRKRVRAEAARRGQAVPVVHRPAASSSAPSSSLSSSRS